MRSHLITSALTIAFAFSGSIVPAVGEPIAIATATQQQTSEIDRAIAQQPTSELKRVQSEAERLMKEGSKESLLDAIPQLEMALQLSQSEDNKDKRALALVSLGSIYNKLGGQKKALFYYNQALPILYELKNRLIEASTLNNIGLVYDHLGEQRKAIVYYNKARSIFHEESDQLGEASTLSNIGTAYFSLDEKQKALFHYNRALPIFHGLGNTSGEASILNNIGRIYDDSQEYKKALVYYNKVLPILRRENNRLVEASTLNNIGLVQFHLKDIGKAIDYYSQSLLLYRIVGYRAGEANTLNNIGYALISQKKQAELAIAVFKQSVNVYESIRKDNQELSRELQESYTKSIASTYQALADLLIKQGRIPEAQAVLELLKLKELNTYTRDLPKTSPSISFTTLEQKALDEFLTTYGTAATFARQLSDCAEIKCPKLTQLQDQRDRNNKIIREMLDRLRITLKDQVIDLSKLNTEEFNNAAKAIVNAQPGTVLIYPIITETKIQFLLAFKAGTGNNAAVTFRAIDGETINSETVFKTAQTFRESLQSANSDLPKLKATSQQLYRWLIKPLEPEINQPHIKHLVFATDRVTRNIPIAALHDGQNYLITKPYSLSTITSATGTAPNALPPSSPKVLAVGASQFTGASALPYVEAETNAIVQTTQTPKGIFPGDRFLNQQFTFDTLKSNLSSHNILHIATHGFLDAGNIDNSHLLTSNGDKIDKSKIQLLNDYGLNNIHLVILSACNTATGGKNSDGLEIAGISHYFMKNGTKSVIASLWQVNDPATALFMQQFYQQIQSGKTKAQALQQVQQAFITERLTLKDAEAIDRGVRLYIPGQLPVNSLAHPYYWSPFILIGNNL